MRGRPRSPKRRKWPDNLYEKAGREGYYYYRHPQTKAEFGLGRDLAKAIKEAVEANLKLAGLLNQPRLVDRLDGKANRTLSEWLVEFRKILERRELAINTVKTNAWRLKVLEAAHGPKVLAAITTKDLADTLREMVDDGRERSATSIRSLMTDVWAEATGAGWVTVNPTLSLSKVAAKVKRARLGLDQFLAVYEAAAELDPWVQNMLRLAIVTAQPRECLAEWEFSDFRDGVLWNERGKTGARVKLPASLAVPKLGWRLDESIAVCRDRVLSRYMLHHTRPFGTASAGDPIFIDSLTKGFARARDAANLTWEPGKEPASLHEVRSLALRLYRDAFGRDFAQALAGHKDGATTDIYTDVRGSEWIEVRAK